METKIEGHHFLIAILIAWVAISLWQANVLGLPTVVQSLVKTVLGIVNPLLGNINISSLTGTTGQ